MVQGRSMEEKLISLNNLLKANKNFLFIMFFLLVGFLIAGQLSFALLITYIAVMKLVFHHEEPVFKFIGIVFSAVMFFPYLLENFILKYDVFHSNIETSDWFMFFSNYIGSIFGGIFTLLGVFITISYYQKKEMKLDTVRMLRKIKRYYDKYSDLNLRSPLKKIFNCTTLSEQNEIFKSIDIYTDDFVQLRSQITDLVIDLRYINDVNISNYIYELLEIMLIDTVIVSYFKDFVRQNGFSSFPEYINDKLISIDNEFTKINTYEDYIMYTANFEIKTAKLLGGYDL